MTSVGAVVKPAARVGEAVGHELRLSKQARSADERYEEKRCVSKTVVALLALVHSVLSCMLLLVLCRVRHSMYNKHIRNDH